MGQSRTRSDSIKGFFDFFPHPLRWGGLGFVHLGGVGGERTICTIFDGRRRVKNEDGRGSMPFLKKITPMEILSRLGRYDFILVSVCFFSFLFPSFLFLSFLFFFFFHVPPTLPPPLFLSPPRKSRKNLRSPCIPKAGMILYLSNARVWEYW